VPLLVKAMQHARTTEIVDLCSGGAGPWKRLQRQLADAGWPVRIKLTDKYPHPAALRGWAATSQSGVEYVPDPVDALDVPPSLKGMRTLFEGFHHFEPPDAKSILRDAFEKRLAIGIFEVRVLPPSGPPCWCWRPSARCSATCSLPRSSRLGPGPASCGPT
jgi:hypothetical protein